MNIWIYEFINTIFKCFMGRSPLIDTVPQYDSIPTLWPSQPTYSLSCNCNTIALYQFVGHTLSRIRWCSHTPWSSIRCALDWKYQSNAHIPESKSNVIFVFPLKYPYSKSNTILVLLLIYTDSKSNSILVLLLKFTYS